MNETTVLKPAKTKLIVFTTIFFFISGISGYKNRVKSYKKSYVICMHKLATLFDLSAELSVRIDGECLPHSQPNTYIYPIIWLDTLLCVYLITHSIDYHI